MAKWFQRLTPALALIAFLAHPARAQVAGPFEQGLAQLAQQIVAKSKAADKTAIAVLPFSNPDGTCSVLSTFIADELIHSLLNVPGSGIEIVERGQLQAVLDNLKLDGSGLLDPETTKKVGSQSGAGVLTVGTVTVIGDTVHINARLIATDTSKAISAAEIEATKVPAVSELLKQPVTAGLTCASQKIAPADQLPKGPALSLGTSNRSIVIKSSLVGCYADKQDRDLNGAVFQDDRMTAETCVAYCGSKEFSYAGVQAGIQCSCGDSYGKYGVSDACRTLCAGNPHETCGGSWANSVYSLTKP